MPVLVRWLFPADRQREELVAHVHERHPRAPPPKPKLEEAAVERERLVDVPDLEGDVVEAECLRLHLAPSLAPPVSPLVPPG